MPPLPLPSTGEAAGDTLVAIERIQGSAYDDTLTSSTSITTTFLGGGGNDLYIVDNAGDAVVEIAGPDIDKVMTSSTSYVLSAEVENLTYTGSAAFAGTGNTSANTITGGAGNDTLIGRQGADLLIGNAGTDTASYATAAAAVTVDLATGSHTGEAAGDIYDGIEIVLGSFYDDSLAGAAGADHLQGGNGNGNDWLEGRAGADTPNGGNCTADIAPYTSATAP